MSRYTLGLTILLLALGAGMGRALAQATPTAHQAGLVVRFDDERVQTYCVAFETPTLSGYDLLTRAGLSLVTQAGGVGTAVCRIDDVGCPANDCFCACRGGAECAYWSYWHQPEGVWRYAPAGADRYQVNPGEVEGWSWGRGVEGQAPSPPLLTLAEICAAGADAALPTPLPAARPPWAGYAAFGLIAAGLLAAIWRRRSQA